MSKKSGTFPPMFIAACSLLVLGVLALLYTLLFIDQPAQFKGWALISMSLMGFGSGEILNHPREPVFRQDENETGQQSFYRVRNTCGLGNILDIVGLLLFFVGLSSFL